MLRQINLVLPDDLSNESGDAGGFSDRTPVDVRTPRSPAPSNPWVEPLPHALASLSAEAGAAGANAAALVPPAEEPDDQSDAHATEPDKEHEAEPEVEVEVDLTLTATVDFEDAIETLSLDETDIDLGDLDVSPGEVDVLLDESGELSDAQVLEALQDDISDRKAPIEHDGMRYYDSLDVDRFDKDIDETGEWGEIDGDDKR